MSNDNVVSFAKKQFLAVLDVRIQDQEPTELFSWLRDQVELGNLKVSEPWATEPIPERVLPNGWYTLAGAEEA